MWCKLRAVWLPFVIIMSRLCQQKKRDFHPVTPSNHLSPAHTMEDALSVQFNETNLQIIKLSLHMIFRQPLTHFHYVMPIWQHFMQHVIEPTSSPRTTHSGNACPSQIHFFPSHQTFSTNSIRAFLNTWSSGSYNFGERRLTHAAAVYLQITMLGIFTKGSPCFWILLVKNIRTYVTSFLDL